MKTNRFLTRCLVISSIISITAMLNWGYILRKEKPKQAVNFNTIRYEVRLFNKNGSQDTVITYRKPHLTKEGQLIEYGVLIADSIRRLTIIDVKSGSKLNKQYKQYGKDNDTAGN